MIKRYNRISLAFGAAGLLLIFCAPFIGYGLIPVSSNRLKGAVALFLILAGVILLLSSYLALKGLGNCYFWSDESVTAITAHNFATGNSPCLSLANYKGART